MEAQTQTQTQTQAHDHHHHHHHQPELLPAFLCMFAAIYLLARYAVFRNWTPETRPEASSCLISLAHGTPAVLLAGGALAADPTRSFSSPNTPLQNVALDFSVAYFLTDLAHYLFSSSAADAVLFVAHHVAVLFVFLTCRRAAAHGAAAVLSLLVLAELTSLCQNAWTLAAARRNLRLRRLISPPFYLLYSAARGIAGPYLLFRMAAHYSSGAAEPAIPRWVWASWIAVVAAAISVSILWIGNLWIELFREIRAQKKLHKKEI